MSVPVLLNGLVGLCFLAHDRDVNLYVRARIFDPSDTLLATKDLTHIEQGRYTDASFFMPNFPHIKVRYDPYTDAGFTNFSQIHGSIDQYYDLTTIQDALIRNDQFVAVFEDSDDEIVGEITSEEITFQLIDSGDIIGVIADSETISAAFEDDTLEGVIGC